MENNSIKNGRLLLYLNELKSRYGDINLSEVISNIMIDNNLNYLCPKCEGKGYVIQEYDAYPTNLPDYGWVEDIKQREVVCDVCNGDGYTEKEKKPVYKLKGYE